MNKFASYIPQNRNISVVQGDLSQAEKHTNTATSLAFRRADPIIHLSPLLSLSSLCPPLLATLPAHLSPSFSFANGRCSRVTSTRGLVLGRSAWEEKAVPPSRVEVTPVDRPCELQRDPFLSLSFLCFPSFN